mmetsp:Transcript_15252/g.31042  ORF Transcript_15252/g.31042 Transcript_15252/m.31042 type:complete len:239 (-) Transcript_15252:115-831(-)
MAAPRVVRDRRRPSQSFWLALVGIAALACVDSGSLTFSNGVAPSLPRQGCIGGSARFRVAVAAGTPVAELEIGQEVEGSVKASPLFGVFVDIGAEKDALVETEELQEGLPMERLKFGTQVKGRVIRLEDGKVWMTLRSGSLERPNSGLKSKGNVNQAAFEGVPNDEWFEGEVSGLLLGKGAKIRATAPGCSEPSTGLLMLDEFADGFADTVTLGTKVKVRVFNYDAERGFLDFSMKEP